MLFLFAIVVFGLAAIYTSLTLLARITPALFPGQTLASVPIIREIPTKIVDTKPSDQSVFNRRINLLIIGLDRRPQYRLDRLAAADAAAAAAFQAAPACGERGGTRSRNAHVDRDAFEVDVYGFHAHRLVGSGDAFAQGEAQREVLQVARRGHHHRERHAVVGQRHRDFGGDRVLRGLFGVACAPRRARRRSPRL